MSDPQPTPTPEMSAAEKGTYDQMIQLVRQARAMQERNRDMDRAYAERLAEIAASTETYKSQVLHHDYLMYDLNQHIVLNALLRQEAFGEPSPCPVPPREMPADQVDAFTRGGRSVITDAWVNDTYPSNYPLIYTEEEIAFYERRIAEGQTYIYGGLDISVRQAFGKYPVQDLEVVNLGSITPWYEATLMHFGAKPTVLDYNTIICRNDRIKTLLVPEIEGKTLQFDAAVSISSFEHDGLGAYGDPIDPDGDFKAMARLKKIVKPGGLLYLNVPCGKDTIMWNRARIYGKVRLPLLIKDWTWIDSFGFREEFLEGTSGGDPLLVLRND